MRSSEVSSRLPSLKGVTSGSQTPLNRVVFIPISLVVPMERERKNPVQTGGVFDRPGAMHAQPTLTPEGVFSTSSGCRGDRPWRELSLVLGRVSRRSSHTRHGYLQDGPNCGGVEEWSDDWADSP